MNEAFHETGSSRVRRGLKSHIRRLTLLVPILLAAFGLRIFRLGGQPLWADEIYSVAVARHSISEVVSWVYRDNHPALYWLILHPVVQFLGDAELLVRFPSALIGTLSVALTYTAGRQIFDSRRVGALAALWLTVSPIHVVYSQEARMYAPLAFFGIASTLFLYRAAFRGGTLTWALFGVTAAATAHSHNYGLLLVAAQGLWGLILLSRKPEARLVWGSALSLAVFATLYGPMVPALLTQMDMSVGSTGVPSWRDIVDLFEALGAGFTGFSTPGLTPGSLIRGIAFPSVVVTTTMALLGLLTGGRACGSDRISLRKASLRGSLLLGICLLFPVVFVYGYSALTKRALWQVRGFQMGLGCFALLVGAGLASLRPRLVQGIVCFGLVTFAAANLYPHYFHRYKSTVPDAVAALEGQLGSEDIMFVAPDWDWTSFRYYYRGSVDAIGGREQGDALQLVGVGSDYADLIDPRSLEVQSKVHKPVVRPGQLRREQYTRVWTISHWATPQRVIEVFGDDVTVMHYDVKTREWAPVVYPAGTRLSDLSVSAKPSSLRWDNGLRLWGYRWQAPMVVGQKARLTLFWVSEHPQMHRSHLRLRLTASDGGVAFEHPSSMMTLMHSLPMTALGIRSEFPTTAWPTGSLVAQDIELTIPPELPPLPYRLEIQVIDGASGELVPVAGKTEGPLDNVSVARPPEPHRPQDIAVRRRKGISFDGRMKLIGYDLPEEAPRPGHYLPVWLHWLAERSLSADYHVQLRLLDSEGVPLAETDGSLSDTSFPTSLWERGDLVESKVGLVLSPEMEGGRYRLAVRVVNSQTGQPLLGSHAWTPFSKEWITIGRAEILPWPLVTEAPVMDHETDARFGEAVRLLGYDLTGVPDPGARLSLTLYWRAQESLDTSYSVFVHLADQAGELVTQADGIPAGWLRPTTTWREGEVIADEHTLNLPPELPAGDYRLYVGFYKPERERLPVFFQGERVPDGRLPLTSLRVEGMK